VRRTVGGIVIQQLERPFIKRSLAAIDDLCVLRKSIQEGIINPVSVHQFTDSCSKLSNGGMVSIRVDYGFKASELRFSFSRGEHFTPKNGKDDILHSLVRIRRTAIDRERRGLVNSSLSDDQPAGLSNQGIDDTLFDPEGKSPIDTHSDRLLDAKNSSKNGWFLQALVSIPERR
jgi:hypothetical protein